MNRRVSVFISTIVAVLFSSIGIANAHVEFSENSKTFSVNRHVSLDLVIPHDCSSKSKSNEIDIKLSKKLGDIMPVGILQGGKNVKNWRFSQSMLNGEKILIAKGPDISTKAKTLHIFFMVTTPKTPGVVDIPVVQKCNKNEKILWNESHPLDGSEPGENSRPVPQIVVK